MAATIAFSGTSLTVSTAPASALLLTIAQARRPFPEFHDTGAMSRALF
jgi:hypothetical protein